MSAYVSIRQHTSADASMRQHTSAYVIIAAFARSCSRRSYICIHVCQHTSAYVSIRPIRQHTSAHVSIRHHCRVIPLFFAQVLYVSIRQHTSACVSTRQHTSAYVCIRRVIPLFFAQVLYVSIRPHTSYMSAYVSIRQHTPRLRTLVRAIYLSSSRHIPYAFCLTSLCLTFALWLAPYLPFALCLMSAESKACQKTLVYAALSY
jgi:hypothetical protein